MSTIILDAKIRGQWMLVAVLATLVTGVGLFAQPASGAHFEGTFENPPVVGWTTYSEGTPFGPWTVTAGDVDHGPTPAGTTCQGSAGQCVDLNGSVPGAISQVFDTRVGGACQVWFWMSRHVQQATQATLVPSVDSVDLAAVTHNLPGVARNDGKWEQKTFSFVAAGPTTTLGFRSTTSGAAGPQIDNVSVGCRPPAG